jgi:hypothetical protein
MAHHVNGDTLLGNQWSKDQELAADFSAAVWLTRFGVTKQEMLEVFDSLQLPKGSVAGYPTRAERRAKVIEGCDSQRGLTTQPLVPEGRTERPLAPPRRDPAPTGPVQKVTITGDARIQFLFVPSPHGKVPGMTINVPGRVENSDGQMLQVVARFISEGTGAPLFANVQEAAFRDSNGLVAAGPLLIRVTDAGLDLQSVTVTVPLYALNMQPTGFNSIYWLYAVVYVYLDNALVAQTAPTRFPLLW